MKQQRELWSLVQWRPFVDSIELAEAIQLQVRQRELDFRTRLLVRDSLDALESCWGRVRMDTWLAQCPERGRLESIWQENLGEPGFRTLRERLMVQTDPEEVLIFLRELDLHLNDTFQLFVGGSIALILPGYLRRSTDDLDVADEVPEGIRKEHKRLGELRARHGLRFTHFQSPDLPSGWTSRVHSLGEFLHLQVFLVDMYDIFVGKVFSVREKDRDDLRELVPLLDRAILIQRIKDDTAALRSDAKLLAHAESNWNILFGEPLPS